MGVNNLETQPDSLANKVEDPIQSYLWTTLTSTKETIENYKEDLSILIDQYIQDKEVDWKVATAFRKFCEIECGWLEWLPVNIKIFMAGLSNFKKSIKSEYKKYVIIDEKYL